MSGTKTDIHIKKTKNNSWSLSSNPREQPLEVPTPSDAISQLQLMFEEDSTASEIKVSDENLEAAQLGNSTGDKVRRVMEPVTQDLIVLSVEGKQAHWHVRGPNFVSIHLLLDDLVEHSREWADLAAERVIALGQPIEGRISSVAVSSKIPRQQTGFKDTATAAKEVTAQCDAVLQRLRTSIEELESLDPSSQDVLIEIERGLTKDRWMIFSTVMGN